MKTTQELYGEIITNDELKHVAAGSGIHSETCYCTGKTCGCSNTCIRDCC